MAIRQSESHAAQTSTRPIVLERESQMALLRQYADEAAAGTGRMVFVGGEMGIGKTTLVKQFSGTLPDASQMPTVSCDSRHVHGPLGPLVDVAHALGPGVEDLLTNRAPREEVFRAVVATLGQAPGLTLLVGEDVHWADDATLDLLYYFGRRIAGTHTLFIATYRDDEIPATHPLRRVLGDLATAPGVRRMILPPLSEAAVARLAAAAPIDPVELCEYTAGNPFMVREILDAGTTTPVVIQDAILARASRLSPDARAMLEAAATIGVTVDLDLLRSVHGTSIDGSVEECLAVGLLRSGGKAIEFRHAAVRDAIAQTIPPMRRMALHRQTYAAITADSRFDRNHALLAFHAEEAANDTAAFTHAIAAAEEAVAYKSHREAAAQYERALRHSGQQPPARRANLLEASAYECYLTGNLHAAVTAQRETVAIRSTLDDVLAHGTSVRLLSQYAWFAGDTLHATDLARQALDVLKSFPQSREMAMALSHMSQLRMLAHDVDEAIRWGERAIALAEHLSDAPALVHALINVGTAKCLRRNEHDTSGYDLLNRAVDLALRENLEDEVSQAYSNLAWMSWDERRLDQTWAYLDSGLSYTADHDLSVMHLCMQARESALHLAVGDWPLAVQEASAVARHSRAKEMSRLVALETVGLACARRSETPDGALDEALNLADHLGELQWIGRIRVARAEAAWLAGDHEATNTEASAAIDLACARGESWMAGQMSLWRHRAGHPSPVPAGCVIATPYRLEIDGKWQEAARFWKERGLPVEEARALASGTDEPALRTALDIFDQMGACADAAKVADRMRSLGFRNIRRGPRATTRAAFGMLTARETEVLGLMALETTNAEIAQRLYLSKRTVEHHVSSILAKLNVATRAEAVARGREAGVVSH